MRQSMVSRETAPNEALAQLCALPAEKDMSSKADQRRAALRRFMNERGLKPKPWAVNAGLGDGVVRNFLAGRAQSLTADTLEKLAAAADATVAEIIGEKLREPRPGRDIIAVKGLKVRAGMGGGFEVYADDETDDVQPFYFRRSWIQDLLLHHEPGDLYVIELQGKSMLPTLAEGDVGLVLLPKSRAEFRPGAIYALWDGSGLVVKRLESKVGEETPRLWIISDNRAVQDPYDVSTEDVHIIGQVLWRGGRV